METDPNPTTMRRPRTRRRLLPLGLALGMLAALLSGCVSLTDVAFFQQKGIGALTISVTGCANKAGSTCPPSASTLLATTDPGQMLFAMRVPTDYPVPATFTFGGRTTPVFRPSPTYTSELQRLLPAGPGQKWAGYISDVHSFTPGAAESISFTFDRPAPADGSPRAADVDVTVHRGRPHGLGRERRRRHAPGLLRSDHGRSLRIRGQHRLPRLHLRHRRHGARPGAHGRRSGDRRRRGPP